MAPRPLQPRPEPVAGITRRSARLAGLFYLGTIVCGLFAELAVRGRMRGSDAAETAANIMRYEALYRAGEAADLVMLCCYIAVTALLFQLFAPTNRTLSFTAAGFSLTGIAVLAVAGVLHLLPLTLLDSSGLAGGNLPIAQLALDLHGDLYGISLVFFGIYCALIGWLCLQSRLLPPAIGLLMIAGGLAHMTTKFIWILSPQMLVAVPWPINVLPLVGETALALWLMVFAIDRRAQIAG